MYDIEISNHKSLIKIKPLNDSAKNWIRAVVLKPHGIKIGSYESVHVQPEDLERSLRKMMASGFKVNFMHLNEKWKRKNFKIVHSLEQHTDYKNQIIYQCCNMCNRKGGMGSVRDMQEDVYQFYSLIDKNSKLTPINIAVLDVLTCTRDIQFI